MASSSDNLITMDPWIRSTFSDAWLSEAFTRDNETLTKALQNTMSDNQSGHEFDYPVYPTGIQTPIGVQTPTPTVSGGSEAEKVAFKGKNIPTVGINGGKITKRKRRKSKRSTTIFITADPVNFRRMVQQVTGAKLEVEDTLQLPFFMPELERRPDSNPMQQSSCCLPTFDTSAFFLEPTNHHHQQHVDPASSSVGLPSVSVGVSAGLPEIVHGGGGVVYDFRSICSFPTLDSWNVM